LLKDGLAGRTGIIRGCEAVMLTGRDPAVGPIQMLGHGQELENELKAEKQDDHDPTGRSPPPLPIKGQNRLGPEQSQGQHHNAPIASGVANGPKPGQPGHQIKRRIEPGNRVVHAAQADYEKNRGHHYEPAPQGRRPFSSQALAAAVEEPEEHGADVERVFLGRVREAQVPARRALQRSDEKEREGEGVMESGEVGPGKVELVGHHRKRINGVYQHRGPESQAERPQRPDRLLVPAIQRGIGRDPDEIIEREHRGAVKTDDRQGNQKEADPRGRNHPVPKARAGNRSLVYAMDDPEEQGNAEDREVVHVTVAGVGDEKAVADEKPGGQEPKGATRTEQTGKKPGAEKADHQPDQESELDPGHAAQNIAEQHGQRGHRHLGVAAQTHPAAQEWVPVLDDPEQVIVPFLDQVEGGELVPVMAPDPVPENEHHPEVNAEHGQRKGPGQSVGPGLRGGLRKGQSFSCNLTIWVGSHRKIFNRGSTPMNANSSENYSSFFSLELHSSSYFSSAFIRPRP